MWACNKRVKNVEINKLIIMKRALKSPYSGTVYFTKIEMSYYLFQYRTPKK